MKRDLLKHSLFAALGMLLLVSPGAKAEGEYAWPEAYGGVMLQGFYWDSYSDTEWNNLAGQAGELSDYFDLIWVPNSGKAGSDPSMGYNPVYWFTNHNSSFGTEAELREMIATFASFGTGIIEDVVVNHRNGVSNWTDFPTETWNGKTYTWGPWAICSNDEVAGESGQEQPTGAPDTGDNFDGSRDLDHTNARVQEGIEDYLDCLLNDFGYVGFRYDMVKGFGAEYVGMYNESAKPTYSVGEYWDNYDNITAWIEGTGRQSAAFDFPFKYAVKSAFDTKNFTNLVEKGSNALNQPAGLIHTDVYRRYSVTFIDNHDTYRDGNKFNDTDADLVVAANAFMLCSPGTPCVFLRHWLDHKDELKQLIAIRKSVGLTNQSAVEVLASSNSVYAARVTGTNGDLIVKIGQGTFNLPSDYSDADKVAGNKAYSIWTKVEIGSLDTVRPAVVFSPDGGYYEGGVDVTLTAENAPEDASIVYTTDETTPSSENGTVVTSGTVIHISEKTTLKAAVVAGGQTLSTVKTATYTTRRDPVVIYLEKPEPWTVVNFYVWTSNAAGEQVLPLGAWPGTAMTETVEEKGTEWYKWDAPVEYSVMNIIFNNGTDQTVNIENVEGTHYYRLDSYSGKTITVTDVTNSGVSDIAADGVTVYPNPAAEMLYVRTAGEISTVEVYAASGVRMIESPSGSVNVSALAPGFYIYRVVFADGSTTQGRFIKQ